MIREGFTFDDVLLVPQHSKVHSRSDIDLGVELTNVRGRTWKFAHPIVPANMLNIAGPALIDAAVTREGLSIAHRFEAFSDQLSYFSRTHLHWRRKEIVGASVGVKDDDYANSSQLFDKGVRIFCVDIAHGDSSACIDMVHHLRRIDKNGELLVIAGNVATGPAAGRLWDAGADVVKVGVGPGSLCTTRIETGCGVPQLTALMEVSKVAGGRQFIADGGLKSAGDMVKALCFADMVMTGNLFAGCVEAPGRIVRVGGVDYKEYVGSSTHKTSHVEGVEAMVPIKPHFWKILARLLDGIKSGCSYQGVSSLADLKDSPEFMRVTSASMRESGAHDVLQKD